MGKKVVSLFLTACFLLAPSSPTSVASDYDSASSPETQHFFHEVNADNQQIAVSSDANTPTTDRDDVLMQHFDGTVLEPVDDDSQSTVMAHNGNPFNDVSNGDEDSELIHITSLSPEIIIEDTQTIISSDCVYTATADPEYLEWLLGAPDEIISASTGELLEYFLKSPFMGQQVYSCSSLFHDNEIDFSCHEVFRELVSREDFIDVLESYAGSILYSSGSNESDRIEFEKLLAQPFVESLISDSEYTVTADKYPNLRSIYTASEVVP